MKSVKKILLLFIAAAIMISSFVFASVGASAQDIPYYGKLSYSSGNDVYVEICGICDEESSFLYTWDSKGSIIQIALNYGEPDQLTLAYMNRGHICMGMYGEQTINIKRGAFGVVNGVTDRFIFTLDKSDSTVKKALESIKDCTECKIEAVLITSEGNKNYYGLDDLIDADFYTNGGGPGIAAGYVVKDAGLLKAEAVGKCAYTGKSIKPDMVIKDGSYTLVKDTDYTLSYKNNKSIGTATVTATLKGGYTGTIKKSFSIVPSASSLKAMRSGEKIKLSWTKSPKCDKYQIQYSADGGKSFKTLTKAASSKTSLSVKLAKGSYVFRIRSYMTVGGKKYYSKWSEKVTVK